MPKRFMLILEAGDGAPEWFHLLPLGTRELVDGRPPILVDQQDLDRIIAAWKARGNDLVIDYEHQTLGGGQAPAAGWIKELQARPDGLWARTEWTDKARQYLESREYRYFSPVLSMGGNGHPVAVENAALTNYPALTHLPPLVAKCREGLEVVALAADGKEAAMEARAKKYNIGVKEGGNLTKPGKWAQVPDEQFGDPVNYAYPMPDKAHAQNALARWNDESNQAPYSPAERAVITNRIMARHKELGMPMEKEGGKPMKAKLQEILKLKSEATDEEVLTALTARLQQSEALPVIAQALGLEETATAVQIGEAVTALKSNSGKMTGLEKEVAALKDKEATREAEALVDAAINDGKYAPAERELAILDAKRDPEHFKKCVAARPKTVPLGDKLGVLKDAGGGQEGEPGPEAPVDRRLAFKAQTLAAEKKIGLAEAQAEVLKTNPELAREWQQSFQVARA